VTYTYEHPHPAVTVDIAVFTITAGRLAVVLVRRAAWPHAGKWALPGGFVGIDESLKRAAWRELREETGLKAGYLEQLGAFGRPDRDPRERVITVVYIALAAAERIDLLAGSDAQEARLFCLDELPELAFDHARILQLAIERLRERLDTEAVARWLMPERFTLTELQRACEAVAGTRLDKRNFRKKLKSIDLAEATGELRQDGAHRPAKLYRARQSERALA
jgi:8-oxo-dGTP diphosphatase